MLAVERVLVVPIATRAAPGGWGSCRLQPGREVADLPVKAAVERGPARRGSGSRGARAVGWSTWCGGHSLRLRRGARRAGSRGAGRGATRRGCRSSSTATAHWLPALGRPRQRRRPDGHRYRRVGGRRSLLTRPALPRHHRGRRWRCRPCEAAMARPRPEAASRFIEASSPGIRKRPSASAEWPDRPKERETWRADLADPLDSAIWLC